MKKLLFILFLPLFSYGQGHYPIAGALDTVDVPNIKATNKAYYQNIPTVLEPRDFVPYYYLDSFNQNSDFVKVQDFKTYADTTWDKAFNDAITYAASNNIRRVLGWGITGTIDTAVRIKSNIDLDVTGSYINLRKGASCYMVTNDDMVNGNINFTVKGGLWNGNGSSQVIKTTSADSLATDYYGFGFQFYNCRNFKVSDLEIDSTALWAVGHLVCNGTEFENIRVFQDATGSANSTNRDGISGSSSNTTIRNCWFHTGDDAVAFGTSSVTGQTFVGYYPKPDSVWNVNVLNNYFDSAYNGVKINPSSGKIIKDVTISGVKGRFRFSPVIIDGPTVYDGAKAKGVYIGDVDFFSYTNNNPINSQGGIRLRNCYAEGVNIVGVVDRNFTTSHPSLAVRNATVMGLNVSNYTFFSTVSNPFFQMSGASVVPFMNLSNITASDTSLTKKQVLIRKNVSSVNVTHINASLISMIDSAAIVQVDTALDKISLRSYDFKFDTLYNTNTEGDFVFDANVGHSFFFNGRWNKLATSLDYIQNQSAATQTGTFRISGTGFSNGYVADRSSGVIPMIAGQRSGVNRYQYQLNSSNNITSTHYDASGVSLGTSFSIDGATRNIQATTNLGVGIAASARLHIAAGTATANTAPLKFTSGVNLTTPEAGTVEFDGTNWFFTTGTTRHTGAKMLTGSASLDFTSTLAGQSSELTVTVTGAADGDVVSLGIPNASANANSCFTARVSATNTVSVKFNNYSASPIDPTSGTFKVAVFKY